MVPVQDAALLPGACFADQIIFALSPVFYIFNGYYPGKSGDRYTYRQEFKL
jgi:hypothetical protein